MAGVGSGLGEKLKRSKLVQFHTKDFLLGPRKPRAIMPVAMRMHEEFSVPHEIPKYDRQIREALKKFDWDASGGLRFQELAKVFKQPGTESGTGTPMTPEQIKV